VDRTEIYRVAVILTCILIVVETVPSFPVVTPGVSSRLTSSFYFTFVQMVI
jgi:hypothetical protein